MTNDETSNDPLGDRTRRIIAALIEVHRHLGPGLMESTYEGCISHELSLLGIAHQRQVPLPLFYKGALIDCGYRLDLLVEGSVVIELKAVEKLLPIHEAQALTYLRISPFEVVLLVNFNVRYLREGLRRYARRGRGFDFTGRGGEGEVEPR
jgi:GxxExxY protein